MVKRSKAVGGSIFKAYAGWVKFHKEELGWSDEKSDREWLIRKHNPKWPRGAHKMDGQLTLALFMDESVVNEEEIGQSCTECLRTCMDLCTCACPEGQANHAQNNAPRPP